MSVSKLFFAIKSRRISSRRQAIRSGNRAGLLEGMIRRGSGERMERGRAMVLASEACAFVQARWHIQFQKAFVRAAIFAAHTDHNISASSKYGM